MFRRPRRARAVDEVPLAADTSVCRHPTGNLYHVAPITETAVIRAVGARSGKPTNAERDVGEFVEEVLDRSDTQALANLADDVADRGAHTQHP